MVARIKTSTRILQTLNYNEKKVREGKAICIHAENYLKSVADLRFEEKYERLAKLASLNTRVRSNCIHISLNFHHSEHPTLESLRAIASIYMQKIGFGHQPYLVYQHLDTYHCHLHLVSTTVTATGELIRLNNIAKNESSWARLEIEKLFGLRSAKEAETKMNDPQEKPLPFEYGKMEMKASMQSILKKFLPVYKYFSIEQLNAILFFYHIKADPGEKGSLLERIGGLYYRALDKGGKTAGPPIKASSFPFPCTLAYLEKRFTENKKKKARLKAGTVARIEWALKQSPKNITDLVQLLKQEQMDARLYQSKQGTIYGIRFIDHRNGAVFDESELGEKYSYPSLESRIHKVQPIEKSILQKAEVSNAPESGDLKTADPHPEITEQLPIPVQGKEAVPVQLKKRTRNQKN